MDLLNAVFISSKKLISTMKNLVLIHGALGAAQQFDELTKVLSEQFNVFVYEFPGHGKRANRRTRFDLSLFSDDLEDWINVRFDNPVNVFGYSMGGYAALYLAKRNASLFNKIVTLGTKFSWTPAISKIESKKLNVDFLKQKAPAYCEYLQSLHGEYWINVLDNTGFLMNELGETPLLTLQNAGKIKTNVTLMLGELDKMVTKEETEAMHKAIPQSEFKILDGVVHSLEKIEVDDLKKAILDNF